MSKNKLSALEDHAGYWLRYVSNHVSQAFAAKVEKKGVTVAEWVLMRAMFDTTSSIPSELAEQLGITRGAISKLVERLCVKKLVKRSTSSDDLRFQSLKLTESGKKLVPVLGRLADENDREFFGHLDSQENSELVQLLQDIVQRHGWKDLPVA